MVTMRELIAETLQEEIYDQIYYKKTKDPSELDVHAMADNILDKYNVQLKEDE